MRRKLEESGYSHRLRKSHAYGETLDVSGLALVEDKDQEEVFVTNPAQPKKEEEKPILVTNPRSSPKQPNPPSPEDGY